MPYAVTTPVFEGPFDLLLHLITENKVDIYQVSLAGIVDAYMAELAKVDYLDLEGATEFLLIASILVELKTRRLLPSLADADIDEEVAFWEERDYLLSRLLECKTFKDAADVFAELINKAELSIPRKAGLDDYLTSLTPDPLEGLDPKRLQRAYLKVVTPKPVPVVDLFHVNPIRISVAETAESLAAKISEIDRAVSFNELTEHTADRVEIAVHFIALLELYKRDLIELVQEGNFATLWAKWNADNSEVLVGASLGDSYEG